MTQVVVNPGICGMKTTVEVSQIGQGRVRLKIDSDCEIIAKIKESLAEIDLVDAIQPPVDSVVYKQCSKFRSHASCPVPMAIIKAIEVEAGMALPKPVSVEFVLK